MAPPLMLVLAGFMFVGSAHVFSQTYPTNCTVLLNMAFSQHLRTFRGICHGEPD